MAAAAASLRGSGSNRSSISNSSSNSSSTVVAVSPSHTLDYDCTDCGSSFLFSHRGRLRGRQQQQLQLQQGGHGHGHSHSGRSHHHSRGNSLSEPLATQAGHAQRLLIASPAPFTAPLSSISHHHHHNMLLLEPQSEQRLSSPFSHHHHHHHQRQQATVPPEDSSTTTATTTTTTAIGESYLNVPVIINAGGAPPHPFAAAAAAAAAATAAVSANDVNEVVSSVQEAEDDDDDDDDEVDDDDDDEVEVVAKERVMDIVACQSASLAVSDGAHDSSSTLAEIFRCFICLGKVVDAQLCPCCSKLVCQPCINRWLTDQKSECPHCRAPLLVSQLVSCRFISEISLEVEKIQGKLGDSPTEKYCPAHDSPLLYFCTTCAVAVCSDCAVLIEDHRNHTFEKLSVAYGRHKKKIRMEAAGLRKRRKELSSLVASVDKNIETVLKAKDESAVELQMALKRMQARLEEQLKCKLLALLAQKGSMTQEMELLDTILHELDQQLNSIPKSDLIAQEPNMSRMLQDIRTRTFSDISRTPVSPEFTSEVVPSYEHGELVLKNYKETLSQIRPTVIIPAGGNSNTSEEVLLGKEVVYSEPISASGVTWRLKVYPNGSGASQGTHLSVFLEMVEGGSEAATYEYGIELQHQARPKQRIVRKFSSDFEEGACWGYYQFFRLDLLEKEGYLQPDEDTVTLKFYVRPLTYQRQCQDLRRSLAALQAERDESATQVAVIRRAFAATFFQRRRRRSSRGTHATHEQVAFAQAVAAGAGIDISSSPLHIMAMSKTAAPIPSMKQLQLKMQEYNGTRAEKWLPGCTFTADLAAEDDDCPGGTQAFGAFSPSCPQVGVDVEDVEDDDDDDDNDTEEASEELVDLRRKNRKDEEECLQQTTKGRAHKKLRSRKVHKLTLLAPEGVMPKESNHELLLPQDHELVGSTTTSGLVQHFESLAMVEAGPSDSAGPKVVNSEESSRARLDDETQCSDGAEGRLVGPDAVEGIEERSLAYPFYSGGMSSSSSSSFCAPEIEDWGSLKNDQGS